MDGYYWELKGGNSSITQAKRQEATELVHSFLFPFQKFPGSRDALSILSHTQLSPCCSLSYTCGKAIILQDLRTLHWGSDVQLMLWFQHSYITAGTERWFINPGHYAFPRHECKTRKGGCKNSKLLPSTLEGRKTCSQNNPNHNQQQKAHECPSIMRPGRLLDLLLGNTHSRLFPKGRNPCCCCAYRHFLCQ